MLMKYQEAFKSKEHRASEKILKKFGQAILNQDGTIDRKVLRELAFKTEKNKKMAGRFNAPL